VPVLIGIDMINVECCRCAVYDSISFAFVGRLLLIEAKEGDRLDWDDGRLGERRQAER